MNAENSELSRRRFLSAGLGGLFVVLPAASVISACRRALPGDPMPAESAPRAGRNPPPSQYGSAPAAPYDAAPPACGATAANIEGPYYRPGAPLRSNLVSPEISGVPLLVTGRVLSLDCRSALSGATLDVWQADARGRYDNDGSFGAGGAAFRLRGKLAADATGLFTFRTIFPGRYLNGSSYRPAHIHVKISAPGHRPLTTQLYFPNDPYNASDPFIDRSLIMDISGKDDKQTAHYDFVLVPS